MIVAALCPSHFVRFIGFNAINEGDDNGNTSNISTSFFFSHYFFPTNSEALCSSAGSRQRGQSPMKGSVGRLRALLRPAHHPPDAVSRNSELAAVARSRAPTVPVNGWERVRGEGMPNAIVQRPNALIRRRNSTRARTCARRTHTNGTLAPSMRERMLC